MATGDRVGGETSRHDRADTGFDNANGSGVDVGIEGEEEIGKSSRLDDVKNKLKDGLAWYIHGRPQDYRGHL